MIIIGVTGGIGSGKSSVSSILGDLGAIVIDADQISREVVEPQKTAWKQIVAQFGKDVLHEDGTLNRKAMADIVFQDAAQKRMLERIIHEQVVLEMKNRLDVIRLQNDHAVVVLDVPIPVKQGFLDTVDQVWVVTCSDEDRISRVMKRNGFSRDEAQNRIRSQMSQEDYMKLAHVIITNDTTFEALQECVVRHFNALATNKTG